MSLFDDVKRNLIEWYNVTSEKTSEVARVTSRRYDKFGISRDIERQFSELGSVVFNGLQEGRTDILGDQAVQSLVERLRALEAELRAKDAEIEAIRSEHARRKRAAAGTVDALAPAPEAATERDAEHAQPADRIPGDPEAEAPPETRES